MQYKDPKSSPAYQLWMASNKWQRNVRKALEPCDVTHVQFIILASIGLFDNAGKQPTQIAISRFAGLDENMTSQVLRTLLDKGFVLRAQHPADGRAHVLALTEAGREAVDAARELVRPATEDFFAPLGDRADEFIDLLRQLNDPCEE